MQVIWVEIRHLTALLIIGGTPKPLNPCVSYAVCGDKVQIWNRVQNENKLWKTSHFPHPLRNLTDKLSLLRLDCLSLWYLIVSRCNRTIGLISIPVASLYVLLSLYEVRAGPDSWYQSKVMLNEEHEPSVNSWRRWAFVNTLKDSMHKTRIMYK